VAPVAPLPEAPASANAYLVINGRQVQLTLRGADELEVLQRLERILERYPMATLHDGPTGQGWCSIHQVPMKETTKNGRTWRSHRLADGSWCKGR